MPVLLSLSLTGDHPAFFSFPCIAHESPWAFENENILKTILSTTWRNFFSFYLCGSALGALFFLLSV